MTVTEGVSGWRPRYIGPVVLAVLFAGTGGLLAVWLWTVDVGTLRGQLVRWQFWALEAQFALLVALSWRHLPACVRSFAIPRRVGLAVLAASLTALMLSTLVAPHTNRIYYDEHIYQGIGQNLSDLHLAQMCNDGTVEYGHLQCWSGEYNKQPYGYPYLLSVAYRLVGANDWVAHEVNAVSTALLVWVVFLLASGLFDDVRVGGYAGLVTALIPQQLAWSHTAASEPAAALTVAFAILTAVHAARVGSISSLLWVASATAFAMQFRTESILVLPVVTAVLAIRGRGTLRVVPVGWAALLGLVLCSVYMGHLFAVRNEAWGASGDRMSPEFFLANLEVNGKFFWLS